MTTDEAIERFLRAAPLGEATRRAYRGDVHEFRSWLRARDETLDDVDAKVLAEYTSLLGASRPGRVPRRLAPATIARKLAAVRSLLRFTLGPERVPDASLGPRRPRRLPDVPKQAEVEALLDTLEPTDPISLRNRALVELVYSAGLRSREAVDLDLADVDFDQELVHVHGKGGKERTSRSARRRRTGSAATCATPGPRSPAAPRTPSSSRCAAAASTRARCAGSSPTPTGSATRSPRTCSRAAPTCA